MTGEAPVKQAFGSPGGKARLAPKIIPLIPDHRIYVEPFSGGAAVYFRKGASEREVLNDKDADIAFAFRFLANMTPMQFMKLRKLNWLKSERLFNRLKALTPKNDIERFYKFYYLKKASFCHGGQSFSHYDTGSRVGIDHLWKVHERLRRTRVHNTTALKIIDKYDSPNTFFYLDPPYPKRAFIGSTFGEYTIEDLLELVRKLRTIKGKFLLSLGTEHQKYLPESWNVRRVKLRRSLPRGGWDWNQTFEYEIVASNYKMGNTAVITRNIEEAPPLTAGDKIPKQAALDIGSYDAKVSPAGEVRVRLNRRVREEPAVYRILESPL